ncbi:transcription initiation factor TFIID subunit 6 [Cryptococcus deuterogattii MMRL2647]|nr:transcription initiation factor TFIID subunit 6 [Cryptococcus deuterogattii MMRL2647]
MPAPQMMGIYPSESIQEVAQSLPLDALGPGAATLLAGDVEYRLHLILQEAKKFMVHAKRSTLMPEDVEHALEALNVEPILIPPRPLALPSFHPLNLPPPAANMPSQTIYTTPDDEIDFASYLKEPLPAGIASSAGVKWKAHWLAVEGVQPAVPENPAPSSIHPGAGVGGSGQRVKGAPAPASTTLKPSARAHLPQELQLYFTRLTTALVPPAATLPESEPERHRLAALASLRNDVAVAGMLVYVVKWLCESIQKCLMAPTASIGHLVDAVGALLANEGLFIEPYMHQLLPPLLSIILTVPLGPHPPQPASSSQPSPTEIRSRASDVLSKIASTYSPSYPGLIPRLAMTLTKALHSPPFPSPLGAANPPTGRYEGAILGLGGLGPQVVREGIWGEKGEGVRRIDELAGRLYSEAGKRKNPLVRATIKAPAILTPLPRIRRTHPFPNLANLTEMFGPNIAAGLSKKGWTASEMVRMREEEMMKAGSSDVSEDEGAGVKRERQNREGVEGGEVEDEKMEVDTPVV